MAEYRGRRGSSTKGAAVRRRQRNRNVLILLLCFAALLLLVFFGIWAYRSAKDKEEAVRASLSDPLAGAPPLNVQLLTVNEFSRPGTPLEQVKGVAIHYTANPGSTAMDNRNYFENLQNSQETKASSHFVVGLDGEIVQCIPTGEISYATNQRNADTISIECCHPDETGAFTDATYASVVELTAWLCWRFGIEADAVIRHYDVTGKECPLYYVQNPQEWERLKKDVAAGIQELKEEWGE